jgi:putative toxin-antitoxin system antitoxin component (TIGR02293 family)
MRQAIASRQSGATPRRYKTAGESLGLPARTTQQLIGQLRDGLPFRALEVLSRESGIPVSEIAAVVGIPERTLARRKVAGKLSADESERLLRISRIFEDAVGLFAGDAAAAVAWLRKPRAALGGETPLGYSATELGAREVENLIGQLAHGVFP